MLRPSDLKINEVRKREIDRIAKLNRVSVDVIGKVRKKVSDIIRQAAKSQSRERYYKEIERYLEANYGKMYERYKEEILNSLNESGIEQRYLIETALGQRINWKKNNLYQTLPNTAPFKYTRHVLSNRAVSIRNKRLAKRVTKQIAEGFDRGESIANIQKRLDIEFGYRDKAGRITQKARNLIKQGKFAHANGHIYQTYRIARTETMRMANIQAKQAYQDLDMPDKRLQMLAVIDSRTRQQSIEMNGQISREDGKFKYPNGFYYFHGEAPARWSINDRETTVTIFLTDKKQGNYNPESVEDYKRS